MYSHGHFYYGKILTTISLSHLLYCQIEAMMDQGRGEEAQALGLEYAGLDARGKRMKIEQTC